MGTRIDLSGHKYGSLLVLNYFDTTQNLKRRWLCLCDCGKTITAIGADMRNGKQVSCGCVKLERAKIRMKEQSTKHGLAYHPIYKAWKGLIQRCYNPNNKNYPKYKNRQPCEAIRSNVVNLIAAIGEKPSADLTIHRVNNNGGYWCGVCAGCVSLSRPMNLKWADDFEQCRHQSTNRLITFRGETHCLSEWAEMSGITRNSLMMRLNRLDWTVERALTTPLRITKATKFAQK